MDLPQTTCVTQLSVVRDKCHTGGQTNQEKIVGTFTKSHLSILSTYDFAKLMQLTAPQSKGTIFMCHTFFPQLLYYIGLLNLECSRCFWGKRCINSCQNNVGCIQNDTEMQRVGEWHPKKCSLLAFHFEGTKSLLILKMTVAFTNFWSTTFGQNLIFMVLP